MLTNILLSQPKQLAQPRVMALFTYEFGVCGVFETFFKVQIPYLVQHPVVKE